MRVLVWYAFCGLLVPPLGAQSAVERELTPETLLLARIKVRMSENLTRLPNYTCMETIERSRRRSPSRRFELVDTVRLEVALVGGKELFSWPGAGEFEERELREMVQGGAIGNGNFALHARSVFLSGSPTYTYVSEEQRDGRRCVRFDYQVPLIRSGYRVRVGPSQAIVAYHGSFWVDAKTLDLIRLEVHADDIPPQLPLLSASDEMEYQRVALASGDFLLPRSSVLTMVDLDGNESRNQTVFSRCRQYTGESFLSFGEPPPVEEPPAAEPVTEIRLPEGLDVQLTLETPIDPSRSLIGDPVTALVHSNVKRKDKVLVPKGAVASGRLVKLEKGRGPFDFHIVTIQFFTLEFGNHRADFLATLEDVASLAPRVSLSLRAGGRLFRSEPRPGVAELYVRGAAWRLARGFLMRWRTETSTNGEKP